MTCRKMALTSVMLKPTLNHLWVNVSLEWVYLFCHSQVNVCVKTIQLFSPIYAPAGMWKQLWVEARKKRRMEVHLRWRWNIRKETRELHHLPHPTGWLMGEKHLFFSCPPLGWLFPADSSAANLQHNVIISLLICHINVLIWNNNNCF